MIKIIRELLVKIINDIDTGNSNISNAEAIKLAETIRSFTYKDERLSKHQSYMYLNISRATFDNYVRLGKLPRGESKAGFKELSWSKKDLDDFILKNKKDKKQNYVEKV